MRPSRQAVVVAFALAPVGLLAPMPALLGAVAALLGALWVDARRARRSAPSVLAAQLPERLGLGEPAELCVTLSHASLGGRPARVALDMPRALAPEQLVDEWQGALSSAGETQLRFAVFGARRGSHALGALHVEVLGPWRLGWGRVQRALELPPTRVVPGVRELADVMRFEALRGPEAGSRRTTLVGAEGAFESLRPYVRGDDPRLVSWKASARHGELLVRRYEEERHQTLIVCVDAGRAMAEGASLSQRVDAALGAAVALAGSARRWDDRIGVLVFSDRVDVAIPPGRHSASQLADLLADVRARPVESHYERALTAVQQMTRRRALVVLFGDVVDASVSEGLLRALRRLAQRHLPLFVALRHEGLSDELDGDHAGWRRAAAAELLVERQLALQAARAAGATVVESTAGSAALRAVQAYREIKRRRRL